MRLKIGELKIIVKKEFETGEVSCEMEMHGNDEAMVLAFANALKTSNSIKDVFNRAVRMVNKEKAASKN